MTITLYDSHLKWFETCFWKPISKGLPSSSIELKHKCLVLFTPPSCAPTAHSQFFSALFLKSLDDAFAGMQVSYLRYNDDFLILCKTKKQLNRCKRKMMEILHERGLKLSGKKTRMGCIHAGFNFLGIQYSGTQNLDTTNKARSDNNLEKEKREKNDLFLGGHNKSKVEVKKNEPINIVPHARTLRKARDQVKWMVKEGISSSRIRHYLRLWSSWWVRTSDVWEYSELLKCLIESCYKHNPAAEYATGLHALYIRHNCDDSLALLHCQKTKPRPQSLFASELTATL